MPKEFTFQDSNSTDICQTPTMYQVDLIYSYKNLFNINIIIIECI